MRRRSLAQNSAEPPSIEIIPVLKEKVPSFPKGVIGCEKCKTIFDTERGLALHKRMWCKE